MRIRSMLFVLAVLLAIVAITQSTASQPVRSSFAGTWTGEMNGLPGMKLTIANAGETISGTVVFNMQKRNNVDAPWHVAGEYKAAILLPHVDNKTLTFEVQQHTCDGCRELGPNARFRMKLTGPDEARLWKLEDGNDSRGYKLVRTEAEQQ